MSRWESVAWKWKQENKNCLHRGCLQASHAFMLPQLAPWTLHWTLAKSDKWELSWDKEGNLLNCSDVLKKKWYSGKGKKKVNLNNTWKVFTISEIKYWSAWSLFIQLIVSDRNIQQCASLTPNGGFKWVWVSCIDYTWNWIVTLLYFVWVIRILKVIMDSQW